MARLHVIAGRRLQALGFLLLAWALIVCSAAAGRTSGAAQARAWAMRCGGLGVLWAPVVVLVPAALEPSAPVEYAIVGARLPRARRAHRRARRVAARAARPRARRRRCSLSADALAGTQLLMRSLLGPDPILGARFYGIGNELKSGLAVLVAAAVAAALYPSVRGRRAARARWPARACCWRSWRAPRASARASAA